MRLYEAALFFKEKAEVIVVTHFDSVKKYKDFADIINDFTDTWTVESLYWIDDALEIELKANPE